MIDLAVVLLLWLFWVTILVLICWKSDRVGGAAAAVAVLGYEIGVDLLGGMIGLAVLLTNYYLLPTTYYLLLTTYYCCRCYRCCGSMWVLQST